MVHLSNVALIPRTPHFGHRKKKKDKAAKHSFLKQNPDVFYRDRKKSGLMTNLIFYASELWEIRLCREWQQFTVEEIEHGRQIKFTNPNGEQKVNVNFYQTKITMVQGTEANLLEFYNTFEKEDRRQTVIEQAKRRQEGDTSE